MARQRAKGDLEPQAGKAVSDRPPGIFRGTQKGSLPSDCGKGPGQVTNRVLDPPQNARTPKKARRATTAMRLPITMKWYSLHDVFLPLCSSLPNQASAKFSNGNERILELSNT
mmetsp:Transcript_19410/g.54087  ORF Transcript_19410/g.54087 Transcript_19410/m.54087 type:complete len:113 (+) Transcript_19410:945-1283(+)